jgi:hypothetical protein
LITLAKNFFVHLISQEYQKVIDKSIDVKMNYYSSMLIFDKDEIKFSPESLFHANDVDEDVQG